jgi:hypothetical protein
MESQANVYFLNLINNTPTSVIYLAFNFQQIQHISQGSYLGFKSPLKDFFASMAKISLT